MHNTDNISPIVPVVVLFVYIILVYIRSKIDRDD